MARWQYTLILEGYGHGASESIYLETEDDNFSTAYARVNLLPSKRAALLADGWYVKGDRMSMKLNTAGVKQKFVSAPREFFFPGNALQKAISTGASLKVLWTNPPMTRRKLAYMAGAWETVNPTQDVFLPPDDSTWTTKWNAYVDGLITAKAGWVANNHTEPIKIIGTTFDVVLGSTTYTLAEPLFTAPFNGKPVKVRVEFPDRKSPLDGVQMVIPINATSAETLHPRPSAPFTKPGRMFTYTPVFVSISAAATGQPTGAVKVLKITGHRRGRPLLVSPGRDAVRPLW